MFGRSVTDSTLGTLRVNFQMNSTPPPAALPWRGRALDQLAARRFDLLVIGGGVIGAGIANEAARAGLTVALVDRADFGSQTSSASSKLVHGGLRYLRLGDVRLVLEAHRERRALMRVVAPHLVRRLPFLLPLYRDGPYRPRTIQVALWLYSTLARERLGGVVPPGRARRSVPALRLENLAVAAPTRMPGPHDGRLCLANVRAGGGRGRDGAQLRGGDGAPHLGRPRGRRRDPGRPRRHDCLPVGAGAS